MSEPMAVVTCPDRGKRSWKDFRAPYDIFVFKVCASSDSRSKQLRILAVTATVGGKTDLEQSLAHLHRLAAYVDSAVFSENNLSEMAREELHDCTNLPRRTEVKIDMSRLEEWFEHTAKKLADEVREKRRQLIPKQICPGKSELESFFAAFASTLEETVKVADDCGVCHAMRWFAGEYLSTMCENQRPDSPANEWLPWVEIGAMLSQLKSYALATH